MSESDIESWKARAKSEGFSYLLIAKDLEDGSYFPVFFMNKKELYSYANNIISESKIKIIKTIEVNDGST